MEGIQTLAAEFIFCSLDHRPIDDSPAYRALLLCGEEVANFFTYKQEFPFITHPPPESEDYGRLDRTIDKGDRPAS